MRSCFDKDNLTHVNLIWVVEHFFSVGLCMAGNADGERVDIVQISRITANNDINGTNRSCVWCEKVHWHNNLRCIS